MGALLVLAGAGVLGAAVAGPPAGAAGGRTAEPRRIAVVEGLGQPEALVYDSAHDAYFVSNVNGSPGGKDGNGFISRIRGDGKLDSLHFIAGGRGGVTLNAPMGSRVRGDTLWVLDVDVLRAFDTRTGAALTSVDLAPAGALFLNDLTFTPSGDLYVTDMRLHPGAGGKMDHRPPDRIYRIAPDRRVSVALQRDLNAPDGIGWDPRGGRFVIAPFSEGRLQTWRPGDLAPTPSARGAGRFDGVEVESDGSILVTIWNDSSVAVLEGDRLVRRIGPLRMTPADVSMDAKRHQVGIVSLEANRFELWTWPGR
jgi:sugar lactone lactonase YvrE